MGGLSKGEMKSLTIAFITSREKPQVEWFLDSFKNQCRTKQIEHFVLVSLLPVCGNVLGTAYDCFKVMQLTKPKPTIWQGEHRITKQDWWAKSNALNTALCLCQTEWIAFVDDRCVLGPNWLKAVERAMIGNYGVCGAYEKRVNMVVKDGWIVGAGQLTGVDVRLKRSKYMFIGGNFWFGCTNAIPMEWALQVNGFPEDYCDGMRYEDTTFGRLLHNNARGLHYDSDMMVIQDRTPGQIGPDLRGEDFGVSPNDKSHALLRVFESSKTSLNSFDIRQVRDSVLFGHDFPMPTASHIDWYTKTAIKEFK